MKVLTPEEIEPMRLTWRVPIATLRWHEGSEIVGYWPEGDSYVFKAGTHYLAISRGFLKEALHDALAR